MRSDASCKPEHRDDRRPCIQYCMTFSCHCAKCCQYWIPVPPKDEMSKTRCWGSFAESDTSAPKGSVSREEEIQRNSLSRSKTSRWGHFSIILSCRVETVSKTRPRGPHQSITFNSQVLDIDGNYNQSVNDCQGIRKCSFPT